MSFCRRRTDHRKEQELTEHAKKHILHKTRLSAMYAREGYMQVPEDGGDEPLCPPCSPEVDTLKSEIGVLKEMVAGMIKTDRGSSCAKGEGKGRDRQRSSSGDKSKDKFTWNGSCWHRGPTPEGMKHKRDTCEVFKKLCSATSGETPKGQECMAAGTSP